MARYATALIALLGALAIGLPTAQAHSHHRPLAYCSKHRHTHCRQLPYCTRRRWTHCRRHQPSQITRQGVGDVGPDPAPKGLTRPHLTPELQAWVNAQTYPPELRRYSEDAVGYWNAVPDAPIVVRLRGCSQPGAEHAGGCEWSDYGNVTCSTCDHAHRYMVDIDPSQYPTPTDLIPDPSLVGIAILVTHELGHALGHTHAEGGVMDGDNPYQVDQTYPFEQEVSAPQQLG